MSYFTSIETERVKNTLSTGLNRSLYVHHIDFESRTGIRRLAIDQRPFAVERFAVVARSGRQQSGRRDIARRADSAVQFTSAQRRLVGIVASGEATVSDGAVHAEDQDHMAAGRADHFGKRRSASVRRIPVE